MKILKKKNIAVIVPFYNEEDNLEFFIKEWLKVINDKKFAIYEFYFFFINDGSTDNFQKHLNKKVDLSSGSDHNRSHIGPSCGTLIRTTPNIYLTTTKLGSKAKYGRVSVCVCVCV